MRNSAEKDLVSIHVPRLEISRQFLMHLINDKEVTIEEISHKIGIALEDLQLAIALLKTKGLINQMSSTKGNEIVSISLRTQENGIIGLDLGGTKLYGAVSDFAGNILYDRELKIHANTGEACLEMLFEMIDHFRREAKSRNVKLHGIGVDVPGRVELDTGRVVNAPAVGMRDFPLKERLVARFGYPVFVDNDLKQSALGEAWFGSGKNYRHVVLLSIGTGIAAGMLVDGRPLRGGHERLGELGWIVPGREFLGRQYVGFGALETEASGPGIENRARQLLRGIKDEKFLDELSAESVFEEARKGEAWAKRCVGETVEYLAILVANIMAFYDPDLIILSGGVSRSSELLIPPILKSVEGCVLTQPLIVTSSLGYRAGALGALINLVQNCPEFLS